MTAFGIALWVASLTVVPEEYGPCGKPPKPPNEWTYWYCGYDNQWAQGRDPKVLGEKILPMSEIVKFRAEDLGGCTGMCDEYDRTREVRFTELLRRQLLLRELAGAGDGFCESGR